MRGTEDAERRQGDTGVRGGQRETEGTGEEGGGQMGTEEDGGDREDGGGQRGTGLGKALLCLFWHVMLVLVRTLLQTRLLCLTGCRLMRSEL